MFNWLKRLLSDPPAASLPGDIANPPPEVPEFLPSKDDRIEDARRLLEEAFDILGDCGLLHFEIKDIACEVLDEGYCGEDEDDYDEWFSGEDDDDDDCDDDGCDCSIDCECPGCRDADDDYI